MKKTHKEQSMEVISEYIESAKLCIEHRKKENHIAGYSATLLLLCSVDAIGHGVLKPNGKSTRIDVLSDDVFGRVLDVKQSNNLKDWFRNGLTHIATMSFGVRLEPASSGSPFGFDENGDLNLIRVGSFYKFVLESWNRLDKAKFNPPEPNKQKKPYSEEYLSSLTPGTSGI